MSLISLLSGAKTETQHIYSGSPENAPGIVMRETGADVSGLLTDMYMKSSWNHRKQARVERAGIEMYQMDDYDWIHSHFSNGRTIDSHAFRIEVSPQEITATVESYKSESHKGTAAELALFFPQSTHAEPIPYAAWQTAHGLQNFGPLKTGCFETNHSPENEVERFMIGARTFEMMRHVISPGEKHTRHLSLHFARDYSFTVYLAEEYMAAAIAQGFPERDHKGEEHYTVMYVGTAPNKIHPECEFSNVQRVAKIFFPEERVH